MTSALLLSFFVCGVCLWFSRYWDLPNCSKPHFARNFLSSAAAESNIDLTFRDFCFEKFENMNEKLYSEFPSLKNWGKYCLIFRAPLRYFSLFNDESTDFQLLSTGWKFFRFVEKANNRLIHHPVNCPPPWIHIHGKAAKKVFSNAANNYRLIFSLHRCCLFSNFRHFTLPWTPKWGLLSAKSNIRTA